MFTHVSCIIHVFYLHECFMSELPVNVNVDMHATCIFLLLKLLHVTCMKHAYHFVSGQPPRYDGLGQCEQMFRLVALNLTYQALSGNGVRFVILGLTKTRRNRLPMKAFYSAFPEDPKLCPVQALSCI